MALTQGKNVKWVADERVDVDDLTALSDLKDADLKERMKVLYEPGANGLVFSGFDVADFDNPGVLDWQFLGSDSVALDAEGGLVEFVAGVTPTGVLTGNATNYIHAYVIETDSDADNRRFLDGSTPPQEYTLNTPTRQTKAIGFYVTSGALTATPSLATFQTTALIGGKTRYLVALCALNTNAVNVTATYDMRQTWMVAGNPGVLGAPVELPVAPFNYLSIVGVRSAFRGVASVLRAILGSTTQDWWTVAHSIKEFAFNNGVDNPATTLNGNGLRGTGNGTGSGLYGLGGGTAGSSGVTGQGTGVGLGGIGVTGLGTGTYYGVKGVGNSTGAPMIIAHGVYGIGSTTAGGHGVVGDGQDTYSGLYGTSTAGPGVEGVGGTNSPGVLGTGTGTGSGVSGIGGASGFGVLGTGNPGGGVGVRGQGVGLGNGVEGFGDPATGGYGVKGQGGLASEGGIFAAGTAASSTIPHPAVRLTNGYLKFSDGVSAPTGNYGVKNQLTPKSIVKAFGYVHFTGGGVDFVDLYNCILGTPNLATGSIPLTFATLGEDASMAGSTYTVVVNGARAGAAAWPGWTTVGQSTAGFTINAYNLSTGLSFDLSAVTGWVHFAVYGAQ